MTTPNIP